MLDDYSLQELVKLSFVVEKILSSLETDWDYYFNSEKDKARLEHNLKSGKKKTWRI